MYALLVQLVDLFRFGHVHYFVLFFAFVWLRWLIVQAVTLRYAPYTASFKTTTTVIVPVVDESPELFAEVLRRIQRQRPTQILVVINGPRNHELELLCNRFKHVAWLWTPRASKRYAIKKGMQKAQGEIVVLVDSDTLWTTGTLRELVKPFVDPQVGGVTTQQKIIDPNQSLLNRFCDWLEDVRAHGTMRAMSVSGRVGCLPGRTIAFRRQVLKQNMKAFMNERFMDVHKEVSDDRSLTNLTLRAGYKTVMQSSSVVYTDAPVNWRTFIRQQLRWSEGSQYNNIRMTPWMLRHAPLMAYIYWTDMIVPFFLAGVYGTALVQLLRGETSDMQLLFAHGPAALVLLTLAGSLLSMTLRQLPSIRRSPSAFIYLIPFVLLLTFVMAPIRIVGFACLADDRGWGTRASAYKTKVKHRLRVAWRFGHA